MDESSLKDALMFFLKEPCGDSCHTLVSETVSIVEKTIKDFQVTGKFDELIDQSGGQQDREIDQYPTPDADDVQSSVIFNFFMMLYPHVTLKEALPKSTQYSMALQSLTCLPETLDEFYRQKSLGALQVLMVYWSAVSQHTELEFITKKIISVMSKINDFEANVRHISSDKIGRSALVKLIWRMREEIVFAIDRLARKYSRQCFNEQCNFSSLRYEYNLLMEKLEVLLHSRSEKLLSTRNHSIEQPIVDVVINMSNVIKQEWKDCIIEFDTVSEYMPFTIGEGLSTDLVINEVLSPLYADVSIRHSNELNYSDLSDHMVTCLDRNTNPLIAFLLNKMTAITNYLRNYEDHVHGLLSEHSGYKHNAADQLLLVRSLFKDLSEFCELYCHPTTIQNRTPKEFQIAQISMAHEMLSKISKLHEQRVIDFRLSVFIPLQDLITRLEYVVYEQSIFVNAYSDLLQSIDDFDRVVGDLSDGKRSMVRPYAHILRYYAEEFSQKVIKDVSKPRHHVADVGTTMDFQAKMGRVIEEADQCLRIHRHPEWFRVGVRLIMSLKHFIQACFTRDQIKAHHTALSKQFLQSDYLPSSSVFASSAIDRLTQGLVCIGHQVRH